MAQPLFHYSCYYSERPHLFCVPLQFILNLLFELFQMIYIRFISCQQVLIHSCIRSCNLESLSYSSKRKSVPLMIYSVQGIWFILSRASDFLLGADFLRRFGFLEEKKSGTFSWPALYPRSLLVPLFFFIIALSLRSVSQGRSYSNGPQFLKSKMKERERGDEKKREENGHNSK